MLGFPQTENDRRSRSLCALVALVIVFVLPLPWGHTHEAYADGPSSVLQSHLCLYHFGDGSSGKDWHFHWKITGIEGPDCLLCQADIVPESTSASASVLQVDDLPSWCRAETQPADAASTDWLAAVPCFQPTSRSLLYRLCVLRL